MNSAPLKSSFRDPSGFVFKNEGIINRCIKEVYKDNYEHLMGSGLYKSLVNKGLLISHKEVYSDTECCSGAYKVIEPYQVKFISYPYEWSFSQLKEAALVTLEVQKEALKFGMMLKDCSAFNIQFVNNKAVFIDTLSFEIYSENRPWAAYRQFCQHFLAPLAVIAYKDNRLNKLSRMFIDGIPLDLASSLLPLRALLNPSLFLNIYMHSKSQKYYADKKVSFKSQKMKKRHLEALVDNLESAVRSLNWTMGKTEWGNYYENSAHMSDKSTANKTKIVSDFLEIVAPKIVWDLGGNSGIYSRIAASKGAYTVSIDNDPASIEKSYLINKKQGETNVLPLLMDLTNPSPGVGWENRERMSLEERGPADLVMALEVIHHLAISNNVPFKNIASFFSRLCGWLIISFVPKVDSQTCVLLCSREDIFPGYTQENFEKEFGEFFTIKQSRLIEGMDRTIYLMQNKKIFNAQTFHNL
jgi:hypothetical protein